MGERFRPSKETEKKPSYNKAPLRQGWVKTSIGGTNNRISQTPVVNPQKTQFEKDKEAAIKWLKDNPDAPPEQRARIRKEYGL